MSIATMILGESGTGKTTSLRNLDPTNTLLIQSIKKPLPFRSSGWGYLTKENRTGNVIVSDDWIFIINTMKKTGRKVIVIDDFQYIMANEFMRRSEETGFQKFSDIGRYAWEIFTHSAGLPDDVRVYLLSHTSNDDMGHTKCKTIGKLLDEKITVEGMFTVVLRTAVDGDKYFFSTKNNGYDTVKSPMGMFDSNRIENDLDVVDAAICAYYEIPSKKEQAA